MQTNQIMGLLLLVVSCAPDKTSDEVSNSELTQSANVAMTSSKSDSGDHDGSTIDAPKSEESELHRESDDQPNYQLNLTIAHAGPHIAISAFSGTLSCANGQVFTVTQLSNTVEPMNKGDGCTLHLHTIQLSNGAIEKEFRQNTDGSLVDVSGGTLKLFVERNLACDTKTSNCAADVLPRYARRYNQI